MQDYIKSAYFKADFFQELQYLERYHFKLVDSAQECDELDQYIMSRFDELFGDLDAPKIFSTYVLNLYRAYCILSVWLRFDSTILGDKKDASTVLSEELREDRMGLGDTKVIERIEQFIYYAHWFRFAVFDGNRKIDEKGIEERRKKRENVPDDIKKAFVGAGDWWFCAGKMLLNYTELVKDKLHTIEREKGSEQCYLYCKEVIPYYKELYDLVPTIDEEKEEDIVFEDTSYLTLDDKEEIDCIIGELQYYIDTYEESERQKALQHLSLEAILKDCPKLSRIQGEIQKAIDYGCIEYHKGGLLGEDGLLIPRIKQGENTFPSDSAFAYFIGVALDLNERGEKFPELEVRRVFKGETKNGTQPDWAAYWRQQNRPRTDATKFKSRSQSAVYMVSQKTVDFVTRVLEG